MSLPTAVPTEVVTFADGSEVTIRGLTAGETQRLTKGKGFPAALIHVSTGLPLAECAEFVEKGLAGDVSDLVSAITELSGYGEGARFRKRPGYVPGDARPTK